MSNPLVTSINFPELDQYSVISFDVFDTLVFRTVFEPRDVFLLMEEALIDAYGKVFLGFSDQRFRAELNTCKRIWAGDRSAEFTLDDIYDELFFLNPEFKAFGEVIKETELRTERRVTVPSLQALDLFRKAQALQKTIICVSDIYLPKEHIAEILENCGYDKYDKLFVSCEAGANKASGELFDLVVADLKVKPQEILHIGDNGNSDIRKAQEKGLHAYQVPYGAKLLNQSRYFGNQYQRYSFRETSGETLLRGLQKNYLLNRAKSLDASQKPGYDIGYQILGPICYGFVTWIIQHAKANEIKDLYFIAREGWFLQKAFDEVNQVRPTDIRSHYLYASRRSLFVPFMTEPVSDFLFSFLVSSAPCKLNKYLKALELDLDDERIQELGFTSREEIICPKSNEHDRQRLEQLFDQEAEALQAIAAEEKRNYLEYLEEVGIASAKHIGLVDSGWFGRGQQRLQRFTKIANPESKLFGFYLALHERAQKNFDETSMGHGYLYQFGNFENDSKVFLEFAQMIEVFLSAPSESLKKIGKQDGELYPVFMRDTENPSLHPIVEQMQEGAIAFIREFVASPTASMPT
ncbi:MAG: HAD family hydrolase, partial [Cyanobacteria bacterium P01_A01_bin.135]